MPLPEDFPESPYAILEPAARWLPDDAQLQGAKRGHLLPPLVQKLREAVKEWRDDEYAGASETGRALLRWWFCEEHLPEDADGAMREFRYYFAQREAVETIIYLHEVAAVKDKQDLMRFDSSGAVSGNMFDEDWLRFVVKMATGSGKTKVLSLALAWCFFHKCYEPDSKLARNFLIIAPNIIVLDRLKKDFAGLRIFHEDPVLPENGYAGHNWRDDFQLTVHLQDEVRATRPTGNIFLTNIHRVYSGDDAPPSPDDENTMEYFLGKKPLGKTTDSKADLGGIVRDIDELAVFNDEAHHIHDNDLEWFKSIEDIHNHLKQKGGGLALQVDTTATPKHNDGAIFAQTIADYPLVEAIAQKMVKHPVIPDAASRGRMQERPSSEFSKRYADYLDLGVKEWRKAAAAHGKMNKKSVLFVMTDDTKNCDEVAEYLERTYRELKDAVLVIHTKNNGDFYAAAPGKKQAELETLRKAANNIDSADSPYKAIVSVLVLKEGWDVRNVTTIVGLRAYVAQSNILPEQTLGRGLRRMYPDADADAGERLSVIGTDAFMKFVESVEKEGVTLERGEMGAGNVARPMVIEVDVANKKKNIAELDIEIPVLAPRAYRDYERLEKLDSKTFDHEKIAYREFGETESEEIVFRYMATDETSHKTKLDAGGMSDYRSALGFFSQMIIKDLKLVSAYDIIYGKVKTFVREDLFSRPVDLDDRNTLRNLCEPDVTGKIISLFKKEINAVTLRDKGAAEIVRRMKVADTRPFLVKQQTYFTPKKSVFNKIIGDRSELELRFAEFLDRCGDIVSYAKNYSAVGFRLDYLGAHGDVANYYPDFLVKKSPREIYIVETKGREELDLPQKMERLKQWCADVNAAQPEAEYGFVYVDEESFRRHPPRTFAGLLAGFRQYQ